VLEVSRLDTELCKQIALWAWVAAGAGFLILMYASLGWVGPAPAFLIWTAGALPLYLLTWWWRSRIGFSASPRTNLIALFTWVLLCAAVPLIHPPTSQAPSAVQWLLIGALVLFPVALTWYTIRAIDEYRPQSRSAA
jgi:hypothetical protein